eukprot:6520224-Pyramimonas_sp.AAC.1
MRIDWITKRGACGTERKGALSPCAIGARYGYILSLLPRLVPATCIIEGIPTYLLDERGAELRDALLEAHVSEHREVAADGRHRLHDAEVPRHDDVHVGMPHFHRHLQPGRLLERPARFRREHCAVYLRRCNSISR